MITLHVNNIKNMLNSSLLTSPHIFMNSKQLYACFIIFHCNCNQTFEQFLVSFIINGWISRLYFPMAGGLEKEMRIQTKPDSIFPKNWVRLDLY